MSDKGVHGSLLIGSTMAIGESPGTLDAGEKIVTICSTSQRKKLLKVTQVESKPLIFGLESMSA